MDTLREQMRKLLLAARDICDQAEKEARDFTPEEREKVGNMLSEAKKLKEQIKSAAGDAALRQAVMDLGEGIELAPAHTFQPGGRPIKGRSLSDQVVGAPEFQAWMKQIAPAGRISESTKGLASPPVGISSKQLISGVDPTSAGAFIVPDQTGIYEPIGRYPLTLRDLIQVRTTTSDTVEFVQQTRQVTEAAPTPEANVKYPSGATGEITGTKPQGHMNFERRSETVKTIAVYVGVTKRALADAGQIRGIIDQELREDCLDELETQLLTGNGIGENFTGLVNQAGTLVQAFNINGIITARQAITTLQTLGRTNPTAFLFNPTDWETIDLLRDTTGRFLRGDPFGQGPNTLWGVPVVTSFHLPQGSAWLGNWRKAVLWDREQATITMTDSHDDWFIRNLVAILCELRAAFGLIRPSAFVQVNMA